VTKNLTVAGVTTSHADLHNIQSFEPMNVILRYLTAQDRINLWQTDSSVVKSIEEKEHSLLYAETRSLLLRNLVEVCEDGKTPILNRKKPEDFDKFIGLLDKNPDSFVQVWENMDQIKQCCFLSYDSGLNDGLVSLVSIYSSFSEKPFVAVMQSLEPHGRISQVKSVDLLNILVSLRPLATKLKCGEALFKGMNLNQRVDIFTRDPHIRDYFIKEIEKTKFNEEPLHPMLELALQDENGECSDISLFSKMNNPLITRILMRKNEDKKASPRSHLSVLKKTCKPKAEKRKSFLVRTLT
jgi:hypothetical protein